MCLENRVHGSQSIVNSDIERSLGSCFANYYLTEVARLVIFGGESSILEAIVIVAIGEVVVWNVDRVQFVLAFRKMGQKNVMPRLERAEFYFLPFSRSAGFEHYLRDRQFVGQIEDESGAAFTVRIYADLVSLFTETWN